MAGFSAHALEPKQCVSTAELNAAMAAEHQSTIIMGNRMTIELDKKGNVADSLRVANLFTSDMNGNGYNLEGDKPLGQPSMQYCVRAKYIAAQFNDWNKPGVPAFALTPLKDEKTMEAYCFSQRNPGLRCGIGDSILSNADKNLRQRVMMVAVTVSSEGRLGNKLIVTGRAHDGGGASYAVDHDGTGLELFMAEKMMFTPKGNELLASFRVKN